MPEVHCRHTRIHYMPSHSPSASFIDEASIWSAINSTESPDPARVRDVIAKAREMKGLTPTEAAVLLQCEDAVVEREIYDAAREVKKAIYGNRIVLFAPLYITNECGNSCSYCGFSAGNRNLERRTLSNGEIRREVEILEDLGHKRILVVYGEHPKFGAEWIADTIRTVYATTSEKSGEIRRVNVNCAPLDVEGFRTLNEVGIGTYQCFQETYHRETYSRFHLAGKKTDYLWRLHALHRAQEAGIDDVATGVLFGLYDHRFEVLALLEHARQLEKDFGVGPHTISFPRLEPASGSELSVRPPCPVSDRDFKRLVAVLRLAVPYTGLILTTRETAELRTELLEVGVSQLSAGSRTSPGGYAEAQKNHEDVQQFCVGDSRSLDDVVHDVVSRHGYIPSWCTACYRKGRTGDHFMGLARTGHIRNFCNPNALLTFMEYLEDYASEKTREAGRALIREELAKIEDASKRDTVAQRLERVELGDRDLFF